MYPFRAVIVGGSEAEMTAIRREVTNLSVTVDHEFSDINQVLSQRSLLADSKCFFLVKVNSRANMDQLARLNQFFMGKPIVALLNQDSDVSAVLHIQRAVAAQVLLLPLRPEEVRAALDGVTRQFGCQATSSQVIAVLGASEGCGSTTLAINLSDAFASAQRRSCILVELSLRLGRLASYLDIEPTVTVSDLLAADTALDVNAVTQALVRVTERFQVAAGPHLALDRRPMMAARVLPLIGSVRQIAEMVVLDIAIRLTIPIFRPCQSRTKLSWVGAADAPSIQARHGLRGGGPKRTRCDAAPGNQPIWPADGEVHGSRITTCWRPSGSGPSPMTRMLSRRR